MDHCQCGMTIDNDDEVCPNCERTIVRTKKHLPLVVPRADRRRKSVNSFTRNISIGEFCKEQMKTMLKVCKFRIKRTEEKQMTKFTNDEIDNLISEGKTNAEIARAMGKTQTSVNARINRRRAEMEKPKVVEPKPPEPKTEKTTESTSNHFPFTYGEQIMYDGKLHIVNSVGKDRMIIRENATLTPKTITTDDFERNKGLFKKLKPKSESQYENIARNRPDEEPEKSVETLLKPEPAPDAKKLIENIPTSESSAKALENRKPATINPEFEAAVKEMEAQHKSKKAPIKIDLEMESSADPVKPFTREPQGYIDPEWGVIKQKPAEKHIRDYLSDINQLLDILIRDCAEPEMAEQTKKLICYKLVIGFKREIGEEAGA